MNSPLREWRTSRGLTQKQLADALNISNGHLSEVENGISEMCEKIGSLLKITNADNVIKKQRAFRLLKQREVLEKISDGSSLADK